MQATSKSFQSVPELAEAPAPALGAMSRCRMPLIACFALCFSVGCFALGFVVGSGDLEPPEPFCISTTADYAEAFQKRADSTSQMEVPACVVGSDGSQGLSGLMGAVHFSILGDDVHLKHQAGRQVIFAFGSDFLEKILVYGPNGGRDIVQGLGLGAVALQSAYLMVWTTVPELRPVEAHWENLEAFLHSVYGSALPKIAPAIATLRAQSFTKLTGCNAQMLADQPANLTGAGCSNEYVEAVMLFPFNKTCTSTKLNFGSYETSCETEKNFLSLQEPTPVQLRAFLAQSNGLNPLFTGYGYTAEEYDAPLVREYWIRNVPLNQLPSGRRFIPFEIKDA